MHYFKKNSKILMSLAVLLFSIASLCVCYCSTGTVSATTAYADSPAAKGIDKSTISLLENLQNANRQVSATILPSVVTLSVTETKEVNNPFGQEGFPWFFFGMPNQQNEEKDEKKNTPKREYKSESLGSGVIVRKTGNTYYVLTNQHVAGKADAITVKFFDGRTANGKLVGGDQRRDIALVSFETKDTDVRVADLGNSDTVEVGDIVFAVGAPLGYVSTVTQGMVSAVGRSGGPNNNINDFIQTDAAINQGNSGGPLVNIYGQVVGINTWIASSSGGSQGLGFSIPINNVKAAIDSLIQNGEIKYGWVGVLLSPIDDKIKAALDIKAKTGVLAAGMFLDSPAYKGGLRTGDCVIKLNGSDVKDINQLVRNVGELPSGTKAVFTVIRDGLEKNISVKVTDRDPKVVNNSAKLWPGFSPYPLDAEVLEKLKLGKNQTGILVASVTNKTPAALIGLKSGDVIIAVNDKKIHNLREFYRVLASAEKEVWFDVIRDEQTLSTLRYKL